MKIALTDERISTKCERGLMLRGFRVLKMPRCSDLPEAMCSHPDMLMFAHKKRIITSAEYCDIADFTFSELSAHISGIFFTFTVDKLGKEYPSDCIFNALVIGDKMFCKADTASRAVTEYARMAGLKVIKVKQGYPACTVLPLGDKAAITSDRGMAAALRAEGIRTTVIDDGGIILPPYDFGFIGGAAGVFRDTVYFLGDIDTHPSSSLIKQAISDEGMLYESLSDEPLFDLGRIIFYE